jgi:hypothetical protein
MRNHGTLYRFVALTVALVSAFALVGCGSSKAPGAEDIVENALNSLQSDYAQFPQILTQTANQMKSVSENFFDQLDALSSSLNAQASSFVYCSADFFGQRANEGLEEILHEIDSKKAAPSVTPHVCRTDPPTKVTPGNTTEVVYYGYDFDSFQGQSPFRATVQYADGTALPNIPVHVSINTAYEVIAEFQAANLSTVDRNRGPELVLSWGSGPVTGYGSASSSLPIIIPPPNPPVLGSETFTATGHANSGLFAGDCVNLSDLTTTRYSIYGGPTGNIIIDRSKGDPGHPGISQLSDGDNRQADGTLGSTLNYQPISNYEVQVSGHICGASADGPGAIFNRTYKIYTLDTSSESPNARRAVKAAR